MAEEAAGKPTVENRWWAELGKPKAERAPKPPPPPATAGAKFFRIADGYDQDRARDNLTDNNLRLLKQANPEEGEWGYVQLLSSKFPPQELKRIQKVVDLPPYGRGAVIDSGRTIRLLVTGTPLGERVLELALVGAPSFDCWVKDEWLREELFQNQKQALAAFRKYIRAYLSPRALAHAESISARA